MAVVVFAEADVDGPFTIRPQGHCPDWAVSCLQSTAMWLSAPLVHPEIVHIMRRVKHHPHVDGTDCQVDSAEPGDDLTRLRSRHNADPLKLRRMLYELNKIQRKPYGVLHRKSINKILRYLEILH